MEQEVELRRKEQEEVHRGELAEKDKDIKYLQLKETEANLALEEIRKELLAEQEKVRTLWEKSELDGRRVVELEGSLETHGSALEELKVISI